MSVGDLPPPPAMAEASRAHAPSPLKPATAAVRASTLDRFSSGTPYTIHHLPSTSQFSSPEVADSLSGSSTASFSQPASPSRSLSNLKENSTLRDDADDEGDDRASKRSKRSHRHHHHHHHRHHHHHQDSESESRRHNPEPPPRPVIGRSPYSANVYDEDEEMDVHSPMLEENGARILLVLSFAAPLIAFVAALYTLLAFFVISITTPTQLFLDIPALSTRMKHTLGPLHRFQLRQIFSIIPDTPQYAPGRLLVVLLTAPIISTGLAIAAWISACFWAYAAILGDPDGSGKGDDGTRAILRVRGWWERYLEKAYSL